MNSWFLLALLFLGQARGLPQNASISGRVFAADGLPAAGTRVAALAFEPTDPANKASSAFVSLTQTDSAGNYRLQDVPPGNYYVTAGSVQLPTYFPGVFSRSEARVVKLANGATVTGIEFRLTQYPRAVSVRGRVTNIPQQAPAGLLGAVLLSEGLPIRATLGPNGSFEFLQVPPGNYTFGLTPNGAVSAPSVLVRGANVSDLAMEMLPTILGRVRVDDGTNLPVNMNAGQSALELPALVSFAAASATTGGIRYAFVRPDGVLALGVPTPGEYWIRVSRLPLGYSIKEMSYNGVDLRENPLRISQINAGELQVRLTKTPPSDVAGVKVSGRVTDMTLLASGPLWIPLQMNTPGVTAAGGLTEHVTQTLVNPDGTFEFVGIPPGNYIISFAEFPGPELVFVGSKDISGIVLSPTVSPRQR
jgi:hypothetical protein